MNDYLPIYFFDIWDYPWSIRRRPWMGSSRDPYEFTGRYVYRYQRAKTDHTHRRALRAARKRQRNARKAHR